MGSRTGSAFADCSYNHVLSQKGTSCKYTLYWPEWDCCRWLLGPGSSLCRPISEREPICLHLKLSRTGEKQSKGNKISIEYDLIFSSCCPGATMTSVSKPTLMIDPMNVTGRVNLSLGLLRGSCLPSTRPYCVIQDYLNCPIHNVSVVKLSVPLASLKAQDCCEWD